MLEARRLLHVRRMTRADVDAHGNRVRVHGYPQEWLVSGWAPGEHDEPGQPNREDESVIVWTVFAPVSSQAPGEHDLVVLGGVDYEVDGRPADWTRGPWPHPTAGLVVKLKRVEG